jgi:pimeloyl-ACP methyl ester carboxylesterase
MQTQTQQAPQRQPAAMVDPPTDAAGAQPQAQESEHYRQMRTDDGVTIAYRTLGTGPCDVLFLHGWGGAGSGHSWAELLKYLDLTGLRAIIPDLRGHGKSEQTTQGFTTERFVQDMLAVADDAHAQELVVVAFSMSGKWAQVMACTAPERVAGQVLLAPGSAGELPLTEEVKQHWLQVARSGDRNLFEEFLRSFTKAPLPLDIADRYFYDVTHTSQMTLGATYDMCRQGSFLDRLGATRAATLVVGGMHDSFLGPEVLRQVILPFLPQARLAVLDCGHEIPVEQPREAAALIAAFLAGLGR